MEKKVELDIERSSRYCCLAYYVTHHPCKFYVISLLVLLVPVVLTIFFDLARLSDITGLDYIVHGSERAFGLNVETIVAEELDKATDGSDIAVRVQVDSFLATSVIYDCECDNILTPANIKTMARIEEKILQLPNWPRICYAVSINDQGCSSSAYESFASQFS